MEGELAVVRDLLRKQAASKDAGVRLLRFPFLEIESAMAPDPVANRWAASAVGFDSSDLRDVPFDQTAQVTWLSSRKHAFESRTERSASKA